MYTVLVALLMAVTVIAQAEKAPHENPVTPEKVLLGKMLFWEEQLSGDDSMACGSCHQPEHGGADGRFTIGLHPGFDGVFDTADDLRGSHSLVRQANGGEFTVSPLFGLRPQATPRSSPSVLGAGHHRFLNWDGSAGETFIDPESGATLIVSGGALEVQALEPILDPVEMGYEGRTWRDVTTKLGAVEPMHLASNLTPDIQAALQQYGNYPSLFAWAFGDAQISASRIAFALASYERTLDPDQTAWDRYVEGDPSAMTSLEVVGWDLFRTSGQCLKCHSAPLFTDGSFHAVGLRPAAQDPGFGNGAFKTPSLRNAGLRPRLFHTGNSERLGHPSQFWDGRSTLNVHWLGGGNATVAGASPSDLPDLNALGVTQNEVALMFEFVRTALVDERAKYGLPPFDHPDLRGLVEPPPRLYGASVPGNLEPFLVDWVPSYPGNSAFKLGLVGGQPGSIALLAIAFESHEPHVTVSGLPWNLNVLTWISFLLDGAPGEPGHATWFVPLPNDPAFATVPLYYQMFCTDQTAPGGIAASQGTEFFIR
mgnify:CR=1 FL=1